MPRRWHLQLFPYGGIDDCRCLCTTDPSGAIVITKLQRDGKTVHLATPGTLKFVLGAVRRKLDLKPNHPILFQLD